MLQGSLSDIISPGEYNYLGSQLKAKLVFQKHKGEHNVNQIMLMYWLTRS
jgi:hypothetical protein